MMTIVAIRRDGSPAWTIVRNEGQPDHAMRPLRRRQLFAAKLESDFESDHGASELVLRASARIM